MTVGEKNSLDDILSTVDKYQQKLAVITDMLAQSKKPGEIDRVVIVDDTIALRGLSSLESDIVLQVEKASDDLTSRIASIQEQEILLANRVAFIIAIIGIVFYWLFYKKMIAPVRELSNVMHGMANGDMKVEYSYPATANTELGDIARSLKVFKENDKKRRVAEMEVKRLAMSDPLTGLANRNYLENRYHNMTSLAKRDHRDIALLMLDLDNFKPANDRFGHAAGDALLKYVARNLADVVRNIDLVARVGGDEFVVLIYGPNNKEELSNIAKRIISLLSTPMEFGVESITIGVSIGVAISCNEKSETLTAFMKRADRALYQAKEAGRNTFIFDNVSVQPHIHKLAKADLHPVSNERSLPKS